MLEVTVTAKRDRRRADYRFRKGQPVTFHSDTLSEAQLAALKADPVLDVVETPTAETSPSPEPEAGPAAEETATVPEPEGASAQDQNDAPEASAEAPKPGKGRSGGRRKGAKANKE